MAFDPRDGDTIEELLLDWEECRERGEDVDAETLCSQRPDLIEELRRRIERLKAFDHEPGTDLDPDAEAETVPRKVRRSSAQSVARFLDLRLHASGGLGEVYEANNPEFGRQVALKFLKPEHAYHGESRERLRGEAEITGRLEHPGIVPIYGIGHDESGHTCYAMRFIRGLPMDEAIRAFHEAEDSQESSRDDMFARLLERIKGSRGGRGDARDLRDRVFRELLNRFKAVCETIAYAHSKHVLHRDIKPHNVMLGKFGDTLVVDWGLAKTFGSGSEADTSTDEGQAEKTLPIETNSGGLTPTVGPKGTPAFMSPEQSAARSELGPASDVYSLGASLYYLLVGKAPFQGKAYEVIDRVRLGKFPPPRDVNSRVPRPLEAVCLKAMALDPEERYPGAEDLADEIDDWLADRPVSAWREPWNLRARRWAQRHKTSVVASSAAVLVATAVLGIVGWRSGIERARTEAEASAALDAGERLSIEARTDLGKWGEAIALVRRAEGLLESHGLGGDLRRRVEARLAALHAQELDRQMVRDLEEAHLLSASVKDDTLDRAASADAYRRAFRDHGIDLDALTPADSAALIRGASIREELVNALDVLLNYANIASQRDRLLAIVRLADDDTRRGSMRETIIRKDRDAMKRLAGEVDLSDAGSNEVVFLGDALFRVGEVDAALALLNRAAVRRPEDFWTRFTLARAYLETKPPRLDQSLRHYSAAQAIRPTSPAAAVNLAATLHDKGDLDGAEAEFRRALALRPDYAKAHNGLGLVLCDRGDLDNAIKEHRRAVELAPEMPEVHSNLGSAHYDKNEYPAAVASFRRAIELQPRVAAHHGNLAAALRELGELPAAIVEYRHTIELAPRHFAAHRFLGLTLYATGDLDGAIAEHRIAMGIKPEDAGIPMDLAITLRDAGRFTEALSEARKAQEIGSKQPNWKGRAGPLIVESERLIRLDSRLAGVLKGTEKPTPAERLDFAWISLKKQRPSDAARLCREAFAADPTLASDSANFNRYNAACAAARAADDPALDADTRTGWREQALTWLRADLEALDKAGRASSALPRWKLDPDLRSVRGEDSLKRLPEPERQQWHVLWKNVETLLQRTRERVQP